MQRSRQPTELVRELYQSGPAYVYAKSPDEVARAYGFDRIARLASNENPLGPSPHAIAEAKEALSGINRYPDTTGGSLIKALRSYHGEYEFVTGVGMDGVIETCIRSLVGPGERVVVSTPTFSFYGLSAAAQGAVVKNVPRNEDYSVNTVPLISATKGAKITFLCTPNNPSGTVTPLSDIEKILQNMDGILFLDNAYVEFSDLDYRPLMDTYQNLIIGRTMSKVFGLAGCRVGYGFVPSWFKPVYERAATPFALNTISVAAALGALSDRSHIEKSIKYIRGWRDRIISESPKQILPSGANFLMIDTAPLTGDQAAEICAKNGVLVRSCRSFPGLADHYIRVCVGEEWENMRLLEVLQRL